MKFIKKKVPYRFRAILLLAAILVFCLFSVSCGTAAVDEDTNQAKSVNPFDYPEDSCERYIAALARKNDITYEMAEQMEQEESSGISLDDGEVIKYKTVDKTADTINGSGYSASVHIASEVRFIYNEKEKNICAIDNLGNPYIYIPDATMSEKDTFGDFNIESQADSGRISVTGALSYQISDTSVSAGGDITEVSPVSGGSIITTDVKTFAIDIYEDNLL